MPVSLAIGTVRTQLLSASKKLEVSSRGELAYLVYCESHKTPPA